MTKRRLLPGLEPLAYWQGGLVAVYDLVGPPKLDGMARTWKSEEFEDRRAKMGLGLTAGRLET